MEHFKKIGIVIIAGIFVFGVGFFFLLYHKKPAVEQPGIIEVPRYDEEYCQKLSGKERDRCLDLIDYDEIAKKNDFEACLELRTKEIREECKHGIARALKDPELCLKLEEKWYQKNCLSSLGILTMDFKICDYYPDDPWTQKKCHDRINAYRLPAMGEKDDIVKCLGAALEYENLCLLNFYETKFNFECQEVPKEVQDYCFNLKTIQEVSITQDPKTCEPIKDKGFKHYCLLIVEHGAYKATRIDSDKDGIVEGDELFFGLDPLNPDTDGDGFKDSEELTLGTNPKDQNHHPSYWKHPIARLKKLL